MREVIVETKGKGVRKVQVGIDWDKVKKNAEKYYIKKGFGIVCSPRISPRTGPGDKPRKSRSWKTPKKGQPKPKKSWQRHGYCRKPSRRRQRWGHGRGYVYPSPKILNEMGLCIYPYTDVEEEYFWENLSEDFNEYLMVLDQIKRK